MAQVIGMLLTRAGDEDGGSGSDSDGLNGRLRQFSVSTGVMDEKSAAAHALGSYAKHCGIAFLPHLGAALPPLRELCGCAPHLPFICPPRMPPCMPLHSR